MLNTVLRRGFAALVVTSSFALVACGGGGAVATAVPPAPASSPIAAAVTEAPEATAIPAPTASPEPTVTAEPTATVEPTATQEQTATQEPIPTLEPTPTPTPTPATRIDEFGFTLGLNRGAYPQTLRGSTSNQGMTQLEYNGVNVILSWVPVNGVTPQGLVSGTFDLLQQNQPDLTLETISEGDLKIGLEEGIVLGFRTINSGGKVIGGGLIGAWECLDTATSFSMTATGDDAAVVQLRFDRLVHNFSCDGG